MGEGFVGGDAPRFQKIRKGGIEGDHAVLAADFHQADEVFHLAAADAGADSGVVDEDFRGEGAGFSVGRRKEPLGDNGEEGEEVPVWFLLVHYL